MTIEIKKPELEALIRQQLRSGSFHDIDELLTKTIYALREHPETSLGQKPRKRLVDILSSPPFAGSELEVERQKDYLGTIEL